MQTTQDLLDAVKEKRGINSDYALAPIIGITRSGISLLRNGKVSMSDETCLAVAEILSLPPAYVIACAHAERAKTEGVKVVWNELAKKLFRAAPIMAGVALIPALATGLSGAMCILCKIAEVLTQAIRKPATRFFRPA